jgi:hypothetical protein
MSQSRPWIPLADSDWVNIVNAPSVLDPMKDKEEAVREAVKLVETRLAALNAPDYRPPNRGAFKLNPPPVYDAYYTAAKEGG